MCLNAQTAGLEFEPSSATFLPSLVHLSKQERISIRKGPLEGKNVNKNLKNNIDTRYVEDKESSWKKWGKTAEMSWINNLRSLKWEVKTFSFLLYAVGKLEKWNKKILGKQR